MHYATLQSLYRGRKKVLNPTQDSLEKMRHDLRDTTGKIEIKMKEVLETLSSQTTTVEKSADEGWLLKRATHR